MISEKESLPDHLFTRLRARAATHFFDYARDNLVGITAPQTFPSSGSVLMAGGYLNVTPAGSYKFQVFLRGDAATFVGHWAQALYMFVDRRKPVDENICWISAICKYLAERISACALCIAELGLAQVSSTPPPPPNRRRRRLLPKAVPYLMVVAACVIVQQQRRMMAFMVEFHLGPECRRRFGVRDIRDSPTNVLPLVSIAATNHAYPQTLGWSSSSGGFESVEIQAFKRGIQGRPFAD